MACSATVTDPDGSTDAVRLDLRGTPCPLNLIRARLSLEALAPASWLELLLDAGEAEQSVAEGLRQAGHRVEPQPAADAVACLRIRRHDG